MHRRPHQAATPGKSEHQAGPDTSRLAPHLQQEWDHAANAHLGSIIVTPQSNRKAWWRSGMCKTGQPHKWQATVSHRFRGNSCPNDSGKAVCPCNDLAHNHPEVAAEWDWEGNGDRTPETVAAGSASEAVWRRSLCQGEAHTAEECRGIFVRLPYCRFPLAMQCVLANPSLCTAQWQQTCGTVCQVETSTLVL
eukprot:jgi/Astpho2/4211/Aster-05175